MEGNRTSLRPTMSYDPVMADLDRHLRQLDHDEADLNWHDTAAIAAAEGQLVWLENAWVDENRHIEWKTPTTAHIHVLIEVTVDPRADL